MTKIAVVGIGGVGGYIGGLLASHYEHSDHVSVYFIARGENERAINEKGLLLETTRGNFIAKPKLTISDASKIGNVDLLLLCTKSYDLEESLRSVYSCVGKDTILLTFLNGVDNSERIKSVYPQNEVWDGCIYIVSRLTEPGLVRETGKITTIFFGSENASNDKLKSVETIFKKAGLDATLSGNIKYTMWEKFIFISSIATITSYFDKSLGEILADTQRRKLIQSLLLEITTVASANGIVLPMDIVERNIKKMDSLPFETTSSMHSDFQKKKRTELDSLTGHVVQLGKQLNIPTPNYAMMYEKLLLRENENRFAIME